MQHGDTGRGVAAGLCHLWLGCKAVGLEVVATWFGFRVLCVAPTAGEVSLFLLLGRLKLDLLLLLRVLLLLLRVVAFPAGEGSQRCRRGGWQSG